MKLTSKWMLFLLMCGSCNMTEKVSDNFVPEYKGIWSEPPTRMPTSLTPDGAICGNGDIGMVWGGTPDSQCLYLSKNDFWKAQNGYPTGGIGYVGKLLINAAEMEGASYAVEQSIADATLQGSFSKPGVGSYQMCSWCAASENIAVIELQAGDAPMLFGVNLVVEETEGATVEKGSEELVDLFVRKYEGKMLEWPSAVSIGVRALGKEDFEEIALKPGEKVQLVLSFCSNHDNREFVKQSVNMARAMDDDKLRTLRESHTQWWVSFWNESRITLDDPELEKYYYGSQYLLACCSRNTNFPPGLWGNSMSCDKAAWCGDYHLNYNHMAPWWGVYSSNHIGLSEPYDTPILEYQDKAEQHAKEYLNKKGVYYPVGIGPKGFCSSMYPLTPEDMMNVYGTPDNDIEHGYMFLGQKTNATFCTTNMFMRYYSTYDKAYAEKVYPFIRKVADFWEDYLVYEEGRYVDYDDAFWEVGPWEGKNWKSNYGDYNPTQALGLCRMLFKGIIDMSSFLDRDADKLEKWNHILTHLSEIPTVEVNGVIRVKACEGGNGSGSRTAPGFGRVMAHGLVFPSGAFGPMKDPEFARILLDEVRRWNDPVDSSYEWCDVRWDHLGNGFETYYACAARLGYDGEELISELKKRIRKTAQPNLWIEQSGGGIECFSAVPSCINEMLLQGYEGIIRVFPVWPKKRDASFTNLRAHGAFLVSSSCKNGEVEYVTIVSEKGRTCNIENPWGNADCKIVYSDREETIRGLKQFEIETSPEEIIKLERLN